jgi:hypothetical protein
MAPKPSRQEYLKQQVATAKAAGAPPKVISDLNKQITQAGKSIKQGDVNTPGTLRYIDNQLNQLLYGVSGSGEGGIAGKAAPEYKPPTGEIPAVDPNAAQTTFNRQNWKELLKTTLINWGLPTLVPTVQGYIDQGYSGETASLMIQSEPVYQQRFAGNVTRQKAGLPVLSPDEYLATESAYRQSMRAANLPTGFYDDPSDFSKFIAADVSPAELKSRVDAAALSINNADPYYTSSLSKLYGIDTGNMIAYALDPERALPLINKQVQAAQFGAEAARQGLQVTTPMAETYSGQLGVTQQQARQGFEQVAEILPTAQKLLQMTSGAQPVGFEEVTSAVLGGEQSADYKQRLKRLSEIEQSRFAGQAGVGRGSLSRNTAGQF